MNAEMFNDMVDMNWSIGKLEHYTNWCNAHSFNPNRYRTLYEYVVLFG